MGVASDYTVGVIFTDSLVDMAYNYTFTILDVTPLPSTGRLVLLLIQDLYISVSQQYY